MLLTAVYYFDWNYLIFINLSFRIVSTQLGADLTKQIVITDPYRIKVFLFKCKCNSLTLID